ncbi:MAG: radical SAM protein [Planctomycetota bacterium]|nr:radical SAM protein [Planctomycetota bacterium]
MKVALVGAELEENLALRCVHAVLAQAGHETAILDFHAPEQVPMIVRRLVEFGPAVVGLSMVFTARAREFVALAEGLRAAGYRGHVTAGGHFASFHAADLLRDVGAIDSIVHGEGEETLVDLLAHLGDPRGVAGVSYRDAEGKVASAPRRPHPDDLDSRPWPTRPAQFHTYLGLPIANMLSGRGCFANCHFCSINAWYRENPGRRFRQRDAARVAEEMADLYHHRGVRIFNFHDDNFFLPDEAANLERFRDLKRRLDGLGLGRIAIQVKARPDSVTRPVMDVLMEVGLFRVFLGVESNAVAGLKALGRGIRREQNHEALRILRGLNVHTTFNLLMFEPDATLGDLRDNIAFIRQWADVPLNFGRVEVYSGTALERRLRAEGRLLGDFWGYTYGLADPASAVVYEMFREVFLPRNFDDEAMNLLAMRLDHSYHLLAHFWPDRDTPGLRRAVKGFIRKLNEHSADLLEVMVARAERHTPAEAGVPGLIADLAAARAAFDAKAAGRWEDLMEKVRLAAGKHAARGSLARAASAAAAAALMVTVIGGTAGCEMMPAPRKQAAPTDRPTDRPLSPEESKAVEERSHRQYLAGLNSVTPQLLRGWEEDVEIRLILSSQGTVSSADVKLPPRAQEPAHEKALVDQIKTWTFPSIKQAGSCTLVLRLHGPGWGMCEYMEHPRPPRAK